MLLTIFYLTYIAFEWMALLFRLIPPHIYVSLTVVPWGLLASAQSLTTSFPQLLVLRMLLGISEAAFCGVPFYLSFFFKRAELASRVGVFISAAPLATTFASSLAWLITWMGRKSPIAPWRMLFLVEGFPSVLAAVWVWSALPDGPESAWFLSRREKEVALLRLQGEKEEEDEKRHFVKDEKAATPRKTVKFNEVLQTLKDPKCYLTAVSLPLPPTPNPQIHSQNPTGNVLLLQRRLLLHARLPPHHNQPTGLLIPPLPSPLRTSVPPLLHHRAPHRTSL